MTSLGQVPVSMAFYMTGGNRRLAADWAQGAR